MLRYIQDIRGEYGGNGFDFQSYQQQEVSINGVVT